MHKHHFKDLKVVRLPGSEAEVTGILPVEYLSECRLEAVTSLNEAAKLPGFRPGKVPESVLVRELGEMRILEETAEVALAKEYGHIIEESKLNVLGRPTVAITKLAPGVPLEFKITVALEPEFALPDYKGIARRIMEEPDTVEVADEEVAGVVKELEGRNIKAELKEGETLDERVKENLLEEKKFRAKEAKRLKLVSELVKATSLEVPKVLIEAELEKMLAQFKDDVARMGVPFDNYLKEVKKTETEVRDGWRDQALERVKAEAIVAKIAEAEKISPTNEELEHESTHLLSHYPDADPLRVRVYVFTTLRNQKVLEFLENQK